MLAAMWTKGPSLPKGKPPPILKARPTALTVDSFTGAALNHVHKLLKIPFASTVSSLASFRQRVFERKPTIFLPLSMHLISGMPEPGDCMLNWTTRRAAHNNPTSKISSPIQGLLTYPRKRLLPSPMKEMKMSTTLEPQLPPIEAKVISAARGSLQQQAAFNFSAR